MALFQKKPTADAPRRRQSDVVRPHAPAGDDAGRAFSRNRTLTGSSSSYVEASASDQSHLRSPRTHAHHLTIQRRKVGLILAGVLAVSTILLVLLLQFTARVTISVSDVDVSRPVDAQIYEKAVNDYFGTNPVARLRFALDPASLQSYLTQVHPEVATVKRIDMGSSLGDTDVTLTMRRPVAGWTIADKQYYVDASGVAFETNYFTSPSVQIVDQSGVALEQGSTVASNRFLGFVGRVVALAAESDLTVVQAIIPADTTRQLEIRMQGVGPRVKLSIDRPAGEQVEDMARALAYLSSVGRSPEYVDVRVSGKAFYL